MAYFGLKVPHETARLLSEINVSKWGEPETPGHYHITVVYIGKSVPVETIAKMIPAIFSVTSNTKPFTVETNRISCFPPHPKEGTVPIICPIQSEGLLAFRKAVCKGLDAAGLEYDKKFPDYKPHVTLGYSKDPLVHADWGPDISIPQVEWGVGELVLWGGDSGDTKLVVTFPLSLAMTKQALDRAFVQLASHRRSTF